MATNIIALPVGALSRGPNDNELGTVYCAKYCTKNAAKQTRQHAGEKYRKTEYVQHYVCFVNEQVP